jgi:sphingomyelin phosphodiesterase acid-like 3
MKKLNLLAFICSGIIFCFTLWGCKSKEKEDGKGPVKPNPEASIQKPSGKILLVSDIHFNPFYDPSLVKKLVAANHTEWENIFENSTDTSFGDDWVDTYYLLFKSALNQMHTIDNKPDFIVITGDFISHDFETDYRNLANNNPDSLVSFIKKTEYFVAAQLAKKYPNTPIFPVLGNNDGFCGDYHVQPNGDFLSFFAQLWQPRVQNVFGNKEFKNTFAKGGYYTVAMPWDSTQVFIGLNSVFFSPGHYSDKYLNKALSYCTLATNPNAGMEQLQWLENMLKTCQAQNKKAWLAYHIPPGMDVYNSRNCPTIKPMWDSDFNASFLHLIKQYKNTIVANFAGHTHMDDFRVIEDNGTPVSFIHITPSISPKNGNNPAIQLVEWDTADMTLNNSITHYFKGIETVGSNVWVPEYNFNIQYGEKGINANTLNNVAQKIYNAKDSAREKYFQFYEVDRTNPVPDKWMAYWCGLSKLTKEEYRDCYCKKK